MISIIVPLLNEEKSLPWLIENLRSMEGDFEVLLVDGGSSDSSIQLASNSYRTISCEKGRAKQMNAGARNAGGDGLLFLHADCRLPVNAISLVEDAFHEGYVGGCFTLFSGCSLRYRLVDFFGRLNAGLFKEYFGDHGIFIRKKAFEELGGFPEVPLMEDVELSKRMQEMGDTIQLPAKIYASPRRFEEGFIQTLGRMLALRSLHFIGVKPKNLAPYYQDVR